MSQRTSFVVIALVVALLAAAVPAHAAPVLAGRHLGSRVTQLRPRLATATLATAHRPARVGRLQVFVARGSRAKSVQLALYANRHDRPGRRLTRGAVRSARAGRWNAARVKAVRIRAGRRYWIAVLATGGRLRSRPLRG